MGVEDKLKDLIRENATPKRSKPTSAIHIRNSLVLIHVGNRGSRPSASTGSAPSSPLKKVNR
ncbi:hypothetical protein ABIC76_003647 [Ralstonia sp. 1138]